MKCTSKEWDTCRVEKRGCPGCYYYYDRERRQENGEKISERTENKSDKTD